MYSRRKALSLFYLAKPLIPRSLQLYARRVVMNRVRRKFSLTWPIDHTCGNPPANWCGWPDNKKFAFVLMHDVDTAKGQGSCRNLMALEKSVNLRSSFFFVPEKRYQPDARLRDDLRNQGFEVGVHGLNHDGTMFRSKENFDRSAVKVNAYIRDWMVKGFSSPSMHHNLEWTHGLNIHYDISTFDTDPFEPQPDGVNTIFPFHVPSPQGGNGFIELPYTLSQDFTLFVILREKTIDVWKRKLDWIAEKGGMALVNSHPDYMCFSKDKLGPEEYTVDLYEKFLQYALDTYGSTMWHALPGQIAEHVAAHVPQTVFSTPAVSPSIQSSLAASSNS